MAVACGYLWDGLTQVVEILAQVLLGGRLREVGPKQGHQLFATMAFGLADEVDQQRLSEPGTEVAQLLVIKGGREWA